MTVSQEKKLDKLLEQMEKALKGITAIYKKVHGKPNIIILAVLLGTTAWAQDAPPAFALRLGTSCEGSATPKCGGSLGLVIGGGDTRSVSNVTTRYLPDGRFSQTFSTGIERTLYATRIASLFACGQAGVAVVRDARSGLAAGCFGLATAPFFKRPGVALSIVPIGWASNAPAEDGSWNGGATVSIQLDFGE